MKLKVIFMIINMNIGGTEKALLSMIDEMDKEKWDVTILMLERAGGFLEDVPQWIKVKYVKEYSELKPLVQNPPIVTVKNLLKKGRIIKGSSLAFHYGISKVSKSLLHWYNYVLKEITPLEESYDVAVAYAGPMDLITTFVSEKISAKKKVQWIHFDISKITFDEGIVKKLYPRFNKIFVVSEEGKKKLINKFSFLNQNTEVFHNVVSKAKIAKLADGERSYEDSYNGIRILTVGRLSKEKGQDLIIDALVKLKSEGYKVRWYCIGDGNLKDQCLKLRRRLNLEENFILLGSKKNPYPFMKCCDIYVQPSRHEGYCITLAEARCFNNPIVATDFTGAKEQVEHGKTGLICDSNSESIFKAVKELIDNTNLRKNIISNMISIKKDDSNDIYKLDNLL